MFGVGLVVGLLLAAALLVLAVQNTEDVSVTWLAWTVTAAHVVVLLIAIVGGVVLGVLLAGFVRSRRTRRSDV